MELLNKISNIIDKAVISVCVVFLAIMTFLAGFQCFSRYVLNHGVVWSEEVCRYLFCWVVLLGSACCLHRRKHVNMTLLLGAVPASVKKFLVLAGHALSTILSIAMIRYGIKLSSIAMTQLSPALKLKMGLVYAVVPISGALLLFFTIVNFLDDLTTKGDEIDLGGGE